jgi:hypothetical protein
MSVAVQPKFRCDNTTSSDYTYMPVSVMFETSA